ncbi:MAG TPA: sulfotransferase [Acetobacteraceae bacterium]|jgi:tetratricopeptide (TPR) repeat protein|nr:sulfotransferase [Acetobacteraceae bacterium]
MPPPEATQHLVPLVERAIQAHRQGADETAERLCLDVLELAPDRPGALSVLYDIRKSQGNARAAEALIRRIVALDPNNLVATNELTLILLGKGSLAEAEYHARNAVRIAPENPQAHNLMGMIMTEANRPQIGEYHYRRVLELTGQRDPILLANLAWNLKNQGRMPEARTLYEESVAAAPDIRQTLLGFARLEEADRHFDAAGDILDRMDTRFPNDQGLRLTRAVLLGRMRRYGEALQLIDAAADDEGRLGPNELLEKGRLLDQVGRYDDAWTAFAEGKRLARELSGQAYVDAEARQQIDRLRGFFTSGRLRLMPRANVRSDVPQPIFILGFPRSGTTLVEQTLSAHPRIAAGDELPLIHEITAIMPRMLASPLGYPEALAELWMGDQREGLDNLRDYYLQKVRQMGVLRDGAARFTDKMPLNEAHLGLIALLFPEAPLIHVLRHPLDIMVSAFSNQFTHGFFCAYDLETAARHYVRVMDLVQHYRGEMTLRYLPVRYEDIVADQEASVRAMLSFIGEDFDRACLTFHRNRRYARTASYAQVTEPLYQRSVHRYRHYRRHLEPVLPILRPVIERLGYTVD